MRRFAGVLAVMGVALVLGPIASAQSPVAPAVSAPPGAVQVGVAGAVSGTVRISSGPAVGMLVESGRPIYLGDVVTTDAQGRLQVLLLDETVFTVGPNSSLVIDEFVYDPATNDGKITAQVLKGAFRFVTGKIAHKKPENMKVTLPAGTIGVRGTMVAGRVEGSSSLVALLGPGPDNNVGARIGKIEVSNPVEGRLASVLVTEPGFGTTIPGANLPPTPPALVPQEVMQALQHDLSGPVAPRTPMEDEAHPAGDPQPASDSKDEDRPRHVGPNGPHRPDGHRPPEGGEQPNGPPGPDANLIQPTAPTGEYAGTMPLMGPSPTGTFAPNFGNFDPYAAAQQVYQQTTTAAQQTQNIVDGVAAREQLSQIQSGVFHFQRQGAFHQFRKNGLPADINGTMLVKMNIDFGSRTIGGGLSGVMVNTTANGGDITGTMGIPSQSFNNAGPAIFNQTSGPLHADFIIKNAGGQIGNAMDAHVHYESTLKAGDGHMYNIPREDGPVQ